MTPLNEFWEEFRTAHDAAANKVDYVAELKQRMPRARPVRRRARSLTWAVAAAAVLTVAVSLLVVAVNRVPAPLTFALGPASAPAAVGEWIAAPDSGPVPLAFSDGTRFTLRPGSRARVVEAQPAGAHLIVERGGVDASVQHHDDSQWLLDVGPFHVQVVGTQFEVDWEPAREILHLRLSEGVVQVSGAFLPEPLCVTRGQILVAECRTRRSELTSPGPPSGHDPATPQPGPPSAAAAPSPSSASADVVAPGSAQAPTPSFSRRPAALGGSPEAEKSSGETWKTLAATGRYREAFALLQQQGFEHVCGSANTQELVQLGDVARLAGHPAAARRAYVKARSASGVSMAAYGLGLTAFDQERNYPQAAQWFRTYLRERPRGGLRREALGRLMEALRRSGDLNGARQVARTYVKEFPDGTHASLARRLIGR